MSYFIVPFSDWDTAFYPLVGKGIFSYHILPYGYIFEHKPYLVYVSYYLWCLICPIFYGKFAILSIISLIITAFIFKKFYNIKFSIVIFFLFIGTSVGDYLSGNTEVIQIPILSILIVIISRNIKIKNNFIFLFSGFISAICININYMSGIVIGLLFISLLVSKIYSIRDVAISILGISIGTLIILTPFIFYDEGALWKYLFMQFKFLHNYSHYKQERYFNTIITVTKLLSLTPILFLWMKTKKISFENINTKILTLWFICSVIASVSSGHNYGHYSILFMVPAMIMCSILYEKKELLSLSTLPIVIYSLSLMVYNSVVNFNHMKQMDIINAQFISDTVGKKKILNIRSDQSLYYLANLETFDPFLFQYHIDIYFGKNANAHYMDDLKQNPPFVLMQYRACELQRTEENICTWIRNHYHIIYKAYDDKRPYKIMRRYYELYGINNK